LNQYGDSSQKAETEPRRVATSILIFFVFGLALRWLVAGSVYLQPNGSHATHVIVWIILAIAIPLIARVVAKTISMWGIFAFLAGLVLLTPTLQLLLWHRLLVESYSYPIFYWPLAVSTITLFAIAEGRGDA
jgi:hypothetical protein